MALPPSPGKSCTLTFSGVPPGRQVAPLFLYSPTSSFFFESTLTTGCPAARCSRTRSCRYRNCSSRSGCWRPSRVLLFACRLYPACRSSRRTICSLTVWPCSRSAAASVRRDLQVHRSGDLGSPRVSGSTSLSSAETRPGSCCSARLRPPPGLRDRVGATGVPGSSISPRPRRTVSGDTPTAVATSLTPPAPNSRASAPSHTRRCRSVRCGFTASNRRCSDISRSGTAQNVPRYHRKLRYFATGPKSEQSPEGSACADLGLGLEITAHQGCGDARRDLEIDVGGAVNSVDRQAEWVSHPG